MSAPIDVSSMHCMSCELAVHFEVHAKIFHLRAPCVVKIFVVFGNLY